MLKLDKLDELERLFRLPPRQIMYHLYLKHLLPMWQSPLQGGTWATLAEWRQAITELFRIKIGLLSDVLAACP